MHYTTSCNTQSSAPEDGQNNCPKHVELIGIINKLLLLHLVGCLYYLYQWCTVKQFYEQCLVCGRKNNCWSTKLFRIISDSTQAKLQLSAPSHDHCPRLWSLWLSPCHTFPSALIWCVNHRRNTKLRKDSALRDVTLSSRGTAWPVEGPPRHVVTLGYTLSVIYHSLEPGRLWSIRQPDPNHSF